MRTWGEYKKSFPSKPSLFECARGGDLSGLAQLIQDCPNLDLEERNSSGFSALMLSAYKGQKDFAEALLRAGVDVESRDSIGNTVLMASSFKGNLEIIKLLLQYGADPHATNSSGMNALDWAKMFGRTEALKFYENSGLYSNESSSKITTMFRLFKLCLSLLAKRFKKRPPPKA